MLHRISHRPSPLRLIAAGLITLGLSGTAQAALIDRGGGLIYDTDLNITWLHNANAALGTIFDVADGVRDGRMTWANAVAWAARLSYHDSIRKVTYTDWRLPTTTDMGTPGCNFTNSGTDCGENVDPASSEMAHLYHVSLGNQSRYTTTGTESGAFVGGANPNSTLDNVGPFVNFQSNGYWSGTEYAPAPSLVWFFYAGYGLQDVNGKTGSLYALAVSPGDIAAVPEAQTYALMLAGLGLIGWRARRRG